MAEAYIIDLNSLAQVGASEDADNGMMRRVLLIDTRGCEVDRTILRMTPDHARQIARGLKRYADFLDPPKKRPVRR